MAIKINKSNYDTYKKVFVILTDYFYKDMQAILPDKVNPVSVLNEWEKKSLTLAKRGIQAGLNDLLSGIHNAPKKSLEEIDSLLISKGLPGLDILLGQVDKTIKKVLKSGKINNEEEYFLIKEKVVNIAGEISKVNRTKLANAMIDFEAKVAGKPERKL